MSESEKSENDRLPLLKERPIINYTKRYDQVSWHSADTDFEPGLSSADEIGRSRQKKAGPSSRRKQKIAALIIVVVIFLAVMCSLIYLYVAKPSDYIEISCGKLSSASKEAPYVYKGVPYALPPIGKLRWSPTRQAPPGYCGKDVFEANAYKELCAGNTRNSGSEDCLYVNVYTPSAPLDEDSKHVIVYVGSDYFRGPRDVESMLKELSVLMDMVVVSVNSRIGVFGFLTIEELWNGNSSYGNYGIQDQLVALDWVGNNIKAFGGNNNSVTIIGGTPAFALLSVQSSRKVNFHKAIVMSGSPNFNTSYLKASQANRVFLNKSKCADHKNQTLLVKCLRQLTTDEVMGTFNWNLTGRWSFPDNGVLEDDLVVIDPDVLRIPLLDVGKQDTGVTTRMPVIIGNTAQETGIHSTSFVPLTLKGYEDYIANKLQGFSQNESLVEKLYGDIYNQPPEYIRETVTSDVRVICPTNLMKDKLQSTGKYVAYRYLFDAAEPNDNTYSENGIDFVTMHVTDPVNKAGVLLRKNFEHFIQFGHPLELGWDSVKTAVLNANASFILLDQHYHKEQCAFWNSPVNGFVEYAWKN